ncbi:(3R)-3-[(carboxymethyl)amino]fatty acid oxygenase/decarboxylase [Photorhabdus tasmaniensis]|uniref:(3R)-3-[(carboxymethyl)amino]fatty acid oxygenase/decarboxylase n=1 Tax=Photorhabdus tasmaniensis TaxID=1004159 RepID=UPI004042CABB
MEIKVNEGSIRNVEIYSFDYSSSSDEEVKKIRDMVYSNKIVVLKNQVLTPKQYVELSQLLGTPEAYYQSMYHHDEEKDIFVSSNIDRDGKQFGVPRTGKFWHADYAFMKKPFAITLVYPQVIPSKARGTYFIDMGAVYKSLTDELKEKLDDAYCKHSVRKYFKIRPGDIYRPLNEVIEEVESETPEVIHSAVIKHPVTKENILYINEGFTQGIFDKNGNDMGKEFLNYLINYSGQLTENPHGSFLHLQQFEENDLIIWDNRSLVHCAKHTSATEPSESFRITLHDEYEYYKGIQKFN